MESEGLGPSPSWALLPSPAVLKNHHFRALRDDRGHLGQLILPVIFELPHLMVSSPSSSSVTLDLLLLDTQPSLGSSPAYLTSPPQSLSLSPHPSPNCLLALLI